MVLDRANPFLAMIFSSKMNSRATELQECFMLTDDEILRKICSELTLAITQNKQNLIMQLLHRLVLLSQNSKTYKQLIDKQFNFEQMV